MGQILSIPYHLVSHTSTYYQGFFYYLCGKGRTGPYEPQETATSFLPRHPSDSPATILFKQHARVRLFALVSNFYLYNRPHYRKGSYREDLVDNLRNVAIPGTGIPLSWMASSRWLALPYLLTVYPVVSGIAAGHYACTTSWDSTGVSFGKRFTDEYARRLLAPDDWFSYWRLNCEIVALHSLFNQKDTQADYDMENKWTFLKEGMERGVPVSPILQTPALVVKHRNEEGGMGIYFYKNATEGGDWILQERIENSEWVQSLLPPGAPLSTFRVITCSKLYALNQDSDGQVVPNRSDCVKALSCVFRAGRKGAATDHDSILFDVDVKTGLIRRGTTNANWYQLGAPAIVSCPWRSRASRDYQTHPDGEGIAVSGNYIPDMEGMLHLVEQAHYDMCPNVPFAGWDVVLSADPNLPVCLLEVNLSCNFFRGSFDLKYYLDFIESSLVKLQAQRLTMDAAS
mmetsp:Transcript_41021/g.85398  ORF Transcript_41021/g.85398 Transcript_41021/m.85398 type:complete len:457 (-) Transcript_41021:121-1491(-)|eukprot:CAMPEP_0172441148 /NCGR_PEP_ID=MMETSP1065-20121228/1719_1 /TAXON_ID=265537 /ORGANISM="Amphiprora paludosa, Strain CCMP125" /LENGTH=456 /DNA_ID=CAMNT_0013190355 /DNA_START=75 /DNA_END=1445 /DNA_ORIENTATION=+